MVNNTTAPFTEQGKRDEQTKVEEYKILYNMEIVLVLGSHRRESFGFRLPISRYVFLSFLQHRNEEEIYVNATQTQHIFSNIRK